MLNDTIILVLIAGAFSAFATTLLWVDLYTRNIEQR
jgi:hypothetical protein